MLLPKKDKSLIGFVLGISAKRIYCYEKICYEHNFHR